MSDSTLEWLINLCRSNDVDVRVDAVTKLQAEFEAGIEISDTDGLLTALKACLRTPNQHLTTAAVCALPPLLPLLIARPTTLAASQTTVSPHASTSSAASAPLDVPTLRQTLNAFLPAGGILDRLGDTRDRARDAARDALVLLGGYAFRCSPSKATTKGPESPLALFERHFREAGLMARVWRVREGALGTLCALRRAHHAFPLRPFLGALVDALEDSESAVRSAALAAVVELFTGPAVTDAARADLKKEMGKKGVRKAIAENVTAQLLSASASANATPLVQDEEYVPPSVALAGFAPGRSVSRSVSGNVEKLSRPASRAAAVVSPAPGDPAIVGGADIKAVYIASSRDLENEFAGMLKHFEGKEDEHNWAAREKAIVRVRGMLKGDVHERFQDTFLAGLKNGFIDASLKTLASLRTTVAANTCSLYAELATALGPALDASAETLYTHLLRMASLTKKIIAQQSQATVSTLIHSTSPLPRTLLPLLAAALQDKAAQTRTYAMGHLRTYLAAHAPRARHAIEGTGGADTLEKCVRRGLADPNPAVKEAARAVFWLFDESWHDRAHALLETLDGLSRRQLEKACPRPEALNATATPQTAPTKKSSVAAAIAASRAKAKAIATAPPTLRHQATAAARTTSPPAARRAASPALSSGPPANRMAQSSSSPPRARVVSAGTLSRSAAGFVPTREHRAPPVPVPMAHPPSPPSPSPGTRRVSSPLTGSPHGGTLRRAMHTALPASPPRAHGYRESLALAFNEDSLLLASNIPIPDDSDEDMELDVSFATPYERAYPAAKSQSQASVTSSVEMGVGAGSPPAGAPPLLVEDALRARAEQAESAAERLLELVDPEEEMGGIGAAAAAVQLASRGAREPRVAAAPPPPQTPARRGVRHAAMFQDSPAYKARATTSPFDVINGQAADNVWWRKRLALVDEDPAVRTGEASDRLEQLKGLTAALEHGPADVLVLQKLARFCRLHPVREPIVPISPSPAVSGALSSPPPALGSNAALWTQGKAFERLFAALAEALDPSKGASELEYGLIVLWEMLEHQAPLLEGREADIFALLLRVRSSAHATVLLATTNFRDMLASRVEPVYGLTTLHASIRAFREQSARARSSSGGGGGDEELPNGTYAFGLIALGKFILRLPAEVLEDELPRLRITLTSALTDMSSESSLVVREAAAASIIAAQLVLRDEGHLFLLLDGLPEDKKNLLTYLFDKHNCRGAAPFGTAGMEKLEREMRRLDGRTSIAPLRPTAANPFA